MDGCLPPRLGSGHQLGSWPRAPAWGPRPGPSLPVCGPVSSRSCMLSPVSSSQAVPSRSLLCVCRARGGGRSGRGAGLGRGVTAWPGRNSGGPPWRIPAVCPEHPPCRPFSPERPGWVLGALGGGGTVVTWLNRPPQAQRPCGPRFGGVSVLGSLRDVPKVPWLMRVSAGVREVVGIPLGDCPLCTPAAQLCLEQLWGALSGRGGVSWRHFLIELLGDRLSLLVVAPPGRAGGRAHPTSRGQERQRPAGLQPRPGGQSGLLSGQLAACPGRSRLPCRGFPGALWLMECRPLALGLLPSSWGLLLREWPRVLSRLRGQARGCGSWEVGWGGPDGRSRWAQLPSCGSHLGCSGEAVWG
ncbi:uncharacterized protein LOC122702666 [Cervus elaphus]|uniref:uncharacterized protein LOC122702666 n=1 Tax=Cervus elaphus TaxID=9860 RepID=UPI001CC2E007|nr:uncharacterized protein LOC122702666 [Cervus elaphus]